MSNPVFPEIKKNLGLGCMRLPKVDGEPDYEAIKQIVDTFLEAGFNYFDIARPYMEGQNEKALRECLTSRYPRDRYVLTNKLSMGLFNSREEIRPVFEDQLKVCGVDYFDFYLMHAQGRNNYEKYCRCGAYEVAKQLREEGKIRHLGISFHDKASFLEKILQEHPCIEVVQLQLNYADFDSPSVESGKCLEVCRKYGKPVIVMEPVKGGSLVKLPESAQKVFDELDGGSNASYAIRFAASQEGVFMVLSGMGDVEMVRENCSFMADFRPLDDREKAAVEKVCDIFKGMDAIACTECRYCVAGCPQNISIPDLFSCMNTKKLFQNWNSNFYYNAVHTKNRGKASDCIECGLCENSCPQHLPIRKLLKDVAAEFEKE